MCTIKSNFNFKKFIFFVVFFVGISFNNFLQGQTNEEIIKKVDEQIITKDYENSILYLSSLIEKQPKNDVLYAQRARIYSFKGNTVDLAMKDVEKTLALNNSNVVALNLRGIIFKEQRNFEKSIADFTKVIQIDPSFWKAYVNRADAFILTNETEKAYEDALSVLKIKPNNPNALFYKAYINSNYKKEYISALSDFNKLDKDLPNEPNLFLHRGLIYLLYLEKPDIDKALEDFNKTISLSPDSELAHLHRGYIYFKKENYDLALTDYNKTLEVNPKSESAYYYRSIAYYKKENYNAAISDLTKIIEINNQNYASINFRAAIYNVMKEYNKALADYQSIPKESLNYEDAQKGIALTNKILSGGFAPPAKNSTASNSTYDFNTLWEDEPIEKSNIRVDPSKKPKSTFVMPNFSTSTSNDQHSKNMDAMQRSRERDLNKSYKEKNK